MAEQQELRVILKTIADTQGVQRTSDALRQVGREARGVESAGLGRTFSVGGENALRFAGALAGVNIGLSLATELGSQLRAVISADTFIETERAARATAAAYGQMAGEFERFASALSDQTGFGKTAILEAALSARTLSANYGLAISQTQQLIRVSADLANVRGIGVAEAFERVQSAIRGEAEASEFLGLTLNDTFIKNNALNGSVKTTFERMTDAQKAQIRYGEVLRQTEQFQGLAAQGANGLEGAQRKAALAGEEFSRVLGGILAPALTSAARGQESLTRAVTEFLKTVNEGSSDIRQAREFQATGEQITKSLQEMGLATNRFGFVIDQASGEILNVEQVADRLKVTWDELLAVMGKDDPNVAARFIATADALKLVQDAATRAQQATQRAAQATSPREADRQNRRLRELNENLPQQTAAESLKEIAFLDQRDAAVREIVKSQREELEIKREIVQLQGEEARATLGVLAERQEIARIEREIANQGDRRVQAAIEARRIQAEQRAAPARGALEDTQRQLERARLVLSVRGTPVEERQAARREIRDLTRNVLPNQQLAAFDAESGVLAAERARRANDLATRAAQSPLEQRRAALQEGLEGREMAILSIQQSIERQEVLANVVAANTDQHQRNLEQIIGQAIADGFVKQKQPMQLTIQVLNPDGSVSYEELLEAEDQASFPPVIQVSGVRRRP